MTPNQPDCYWVIPEKLLAGEYPGAADPAEARENIRALLDAGARSFLDLTEKGEYGVAPYDAVVHQLAAERGLDVRYRRMSIEDLGTPTAEQMRNVLQHIAAEIVDGRPVYVHCLGGIGRTGTVVGCWLIQRGVCSADEALDRIADLRATCRKATTHSPETMSQREFIARWAP
jgi:predicted protein tyrosine phosphatase